MRSDDIRSCSEDCIIESHFPSSTRRLNAEQLSLQTGSRRSVTLVQGGLAAKHIMCIKAVSQLGSGVDTPKKENPVLALFEDTETLPGST